MVRQGGCHLQVRRLFRGAPLEAMRLILSEATSQGMRGKELKVQLLDAKKAHLHVPAVRPIFVELPPERAREGYCCRLKR